VARRGRNDPPEPKGPTMANDVKKGARITGTARDKLVVDDKGFSTRDSTSTDGVPDESGPEPEGTERQE
jgi:hypothetical protein